MKKRVAFLLGLVMLLNAMPVMASEVVYGDADGDGFVTATDSAIILQKVLKASYKMPIDTDDDRLTYSMADVNEDSYITAEDSAMVLQKVLNGGYIMPVEDQQFYRSLDTFYEEQNTAFNFTVLNVGWSDTYLKDYKKCVVINNVDELLNFYRNYINSNQCRYSDFARAFDKYDSAFFEKNTLVLSTYYANYDEEYNGNDVILSDGALYIETQTSTPWQMLDSNMTRVHIMEVSSKEINQVEWNLKYYNGIDEATYNIKFEFVK